MKEETIEGITYKLPGSLNEFQKEMYIHLIKWKWLNVSEKPGKYPYNEQGNEYDAILPIREPKNENLIYSTIRTKIETHQAKFKFKYHIHFNHMASSQAANINLFLPLL